MSMYTDRNDNARTSNQTQHSVNSDDPNTHLSKNTGEISIDLVEPFTGGVVQFLSKNHIFNISLLDELLRMFCSKKQINPEKWVPKVIEYGTMEIVTGSIIDKFPLRELVPRVISIGSLNRIILPKLTINFTDGFNIRRAITNILIRLNDVDIASCVPTNQFSEHISCYDSAQNGDIARDGKLLNPDQLISDLSSTLIIWIYISGLPQRPLIKWFESAEESILKRERKAQEKKKDSGGQEWKDGKPLEDCLRDSLTNLLPTSLIVCANANILGANNVNAEKDILIVDTAVGFRFKDGGVFHLPMYLPSSIVMHIECKRQLTIDALTKAHKQLQTKIPSSQPYFHIGTSGISYGNVDQPIRCIVCCKPDSKEENFEMLINGLHSTQDYIDVDIILIIGYGVFARPEGSTKFTIFLKGSGMGLAILSYAISKRLTDRKRSDITTFLGAF